MNDINLNKLINELKEEGATDREAEELSLLSRNLSNLYDFKRSEELKNTFLLNAKLSDKFYYFSKKVFLTSALSVVLLLGFVSFVKAQGSLPGDVLYPLKRVSESTVSIINPSFKNEIFRRRSEEIKALSQSNKPQSFETSINDYELQLKETENIDAPLMEESRKNLEDAQNKTTNLESKAEIEKILNQIRQRQKSTEDVKGESTQSERSFQKNGGSSNSNNDQNSKIDTNDTINKEQSIIKF